MNLIVEVAHRSLNKAGEEICGDWVKVQRSRDGTVIALSDGLGSGVKANILATLTTEIATSMIQQGASIEETLETITATLPLCKVRKIAYATITLIKIDRNGTTYVAEYDTPSLIFIRRGKLMSRQREQREIGNRKVVEETIHLEDGDYLVAMSDGVVHAGIGGKLNLGWGETQIGNYLAELAQRHPDARALADQMAEKSLSLYEGRPGDDATIVVARLRPMKYLHVFTGPPANRGDDSDVVHRFVEAPGKRIVCGGTTSNVVCRVLNKDIDPLIDGIDEEIPPTAWLPGVGLVTEGVVTLNKAIERIQSAETASDLPGRKDGATELARAMLDADHIHLMVGGAINPMQIADVIRGRAFRHILIDTLVRELRAKGKIVELENV